MNSEDGKKKKKKKEKDTEEDDVKKKKKKDDDDEGKKKKKKDDDYEGQKKKKKHGDEDGKKKKKKKHKGSDSEDDKKKKKKKKKKSKKKKRKGHKKNRGVSESASDTSEKAVLFKKHHAHLPQKNTNIFRSTDYKVDIRKIAINRHEVSFFSCEPFILYDLSFFFRYLHQDFTLKLNGVLRKNFTDDWIKIRKKRFSTKVLEITLKVPKTR